MKILQDPALSSHPIRTAMDYTWAALSGSWKNTSIVAAILLLLILLEFIPMIGFIASIFQSIVVYALAYYVADRAKGSATIENFKRAMAQSDAKEMLFAFLSPAAGYYTGFILFSLILALISALIFWLTGGFEAFSIMQQQTSVPNAAPEQTYQFYMQILGFSSPALVFILIASLFFSYLWPLVYGYALCQHTFGDAFNAVFMFFSPTFWKGAFTVDYFVIVSLWMLVVLGVGIVMGFALATFILIPVAVLLILWLTYFTAIVSITTYDMQDNI